jgi:hypothetical protein
MAHEFFGMGAAVKDAREAVEYAGGRLKASFEGKQEQGQP